MNTVYNNYKKYRFIRDEIGAPPMIGVNRGSTIDTVTEGSLYLANDGDCICVVGFIVLHSCKDKKPSYPKFPAQQLWINPNASGTPPASYFPGG